MRFSALLTGSFSLAIAANALWVSQAKADFWQDLLQGSVQSTCSNPTTQAQIQDCNKRYYVENEISQVFYQITNKPIDNNSLQVLTNNVLYKGWQYDQIQNDIIKHHGGQSIASLQGQRFNLNQFNQSNWNQPWGNTNPNANYGQGKKVRLTHPVNLLAEPGGRTLEQLYPGEVILLYPQSRQGNFLYVRTFQTQQGGWIEERGNAGGNPQGGQMAQVKMSSVLMTEPGQGRVIRELKRGETVMVFPQRRSGPYLYLSTPTGQSGWTLANSISMANNPSSQGQRVQVKIPSVLLSQPGKGRVLRELRRGEWVQVYPDQRSGNYIYVETEDGQQGWTQVF